MNGKSSVRYILALGCLFILTDTSQMMAANIRSFIEAVRRKAPVVYVGSVREVQLLTRTKFDIKARAVVSVSAVARGPHPKPSEATVEYSSYDDKTPMLAGGPQYQLQPDEKLCTYLRTPYAIGYLVPRNRLTTRSTGRATLLGLTNRSS